MKEKSMSAAQYLYLRWLNENHPRLYAAANAKQNSLSGFADVVDKIVNAGTKVLDGFVKSKKKLETLKTNTDRAKKGLPPLTEDGADYTVPGAMQGFSSMTPIGWALIAMGGLAIFMLARSK